MTLQTQSFSPHLKMHARICTIYIRIIQTDILKVPSVGAGTANTEFEVLTGMNLRYFGPGEYPYKTYSKNIRRRVRRQRLPLLDTEHMHYMITQEISTAVPMYLITWDLIHLPVRSL